ncbi:MAG: aspartate/glutamate racemase family protein [Pseudomonadota bacterium]
MRLLLINPNMTTAMTERLATVAERVAPPDTEIVSLTATKGFPYIASRAEAQIAGAIACEMIAEQAHGADAAIIAAFGDPGLAAARELFDFPIVGMAEASLLTASMVGERLSIVTFSPVMRRWYRDAVRDAGLLHRFTGVRTPAAHIDDVANAGETLRQDLVALCAEAADQDGADVIIPGGAPLAGLASEIADKVDAPLVDPISAATVQAIALASLTRQSALTRRRSKPPAKETVGLAAPLSRVIARKDPQ